MREIQLFGKQLNIPVLDGTAQPRKSHLVLSDLEQMKGYEFNVVVIVNCGKEALPEEAFRDRCRLYVAMTRAKDELYLSYSGKPSPWLTAAADRMEFMSWSELIEIEQPLPRVAPQHLVETEQQDQAGLELLNGGQFIRTSAALGLSAEAQKRLCEIVDGVGLRRGNRAVRWRCVLDLARDLERSPRTRRDFGPSSQTEVRVLFDRVFRDHLR